MPPIPLLTKLDLLTGHTTALDVGTKDGKIAKQLTTLGLEVTAIDTEPLTVEIPGVNFKQISIESFLGTNPGKFNIIIARHILPFTTDPLPLIQRLSAISDIFMFTCFGADDDWKDQDHTVTLGKRELFGLFNPEAIKHYSETFEETKTYKGDMKYWHYHTFVIDNRT